jgi:starvation-inducible outer membrane lipoprotein
MDKDMQSVMSIDEDGDTVWRLDGNYHREDGPAIEWQDGRTDWWLHGKRHRTDGPAIEFADGVKFWHLNDEFLSFDDWLERTTGLTDEEKVMFKLEHG